MEAPFCMFVPTEDNTAWKYKILQNQYLTNEIYQLKKTYLDCDQMVRYLDCDQMVRYLDCDQMVR